MKKLLLLSVLLSGFQVKADCNIELLVKKSGAKTYYTSLGSRMSKSNVEAIKDVCQIKVKLMSSKQVRSLNIKRLKARLAKLQSNK